MAKPVKIQVIHINLAAENLRTLLSLSLLQNINNNKWEATNKTNQQRTRSDLSLSSSNSFACFSVGTFPFSCISFFSACVTSALRLRAAPLIPVVRILTSILPVLGSTAACFNASLYNL